MNDFFINKISFLEKLLAILFSFLILFMYIGRGIYNSALFIILIVGLYLIVKNNLLLIILKDKFFLILLFFIVSVGITVPFASIFDVSFSKYISFVLTTYIVSFIGLFLYKYSAKKKINILYGLYILFFTSVCMEIITITSIYLNINILVYIKSLGTISLPVSNSFHLIEIFTSAIIPLGLFLYYLKPSYLKLFLILTAFIGILASTSRTAMIATAVSIIIFILVKNRFNIFSKEMIYFILSILIASFLAFEISDDIRKRVESFKTTFSLTNGDRMSGRYTVYEESFNRFIESPIVGLGIKNSTVNYIIIKHPHGDEIVKHPHNIWLELLLDTGLIGFVSFLVFVIYLLYSFLIQFKELSIVHIATIVSTLSSIFLSSLASWSIWSGNHIGPILFIILLLYSLKYIKIKETKN